MNTVMIWGRYKLHNKAYNLVKFKLLLLLRNFLVQINREPRMSNVVVVYDRGMFQAVVKRVLVQEVGGRYTLKEF